MYRFSSKTDSFDFFSSNFLKANLGLEIWKTNFRIRITILKIPCVPIKKEFWGRNFKNLHLDPKLAPPRYHVCQFSVKMRNSGFFGLNLG